MAAVRATGSDAVSGARGAAIALARVDVRVGGLRGGYVSVSEAGNVTLRDYVYVPGVTVNGVIPSQGTATLRVTGSAAARGSLSFTSGGRASGRLGGRRVSNAVPRAAASSLAPDGLPTWKQIRALPRFANG